MSGEEYKLWRSSLCSFLQPPVTSSLFGPNILLNTLFSYTLSLCSSLNVRDQVSHPHRNTGKNYQLSTLIKIIKHSLNIHIYEMSTCLWNWPFKRNLTKSDFIWQKIDGCSKRGYFISRCHLWKSFANENNILIWNSSLNNDKFRSKTGIIFKYTHKDLSVRKWVFVLKVERHETQATLLILPIILTSEWLIAQTPQQSALKHSKTIYRGLSSLIFFLFQSAYTFIKIYNYVSSIQLCIRSTNKRGHIYVFSI
jgi:hypothetical protein